MQYRSKFALTTYLRRRVREVVGLNLARPAVARYKVLDSDEEENHDEQDR